jgi:hypothetical protein
MPTFAFLYTPLQGILRDFRRKGIISSPGIIKKPALGRILQWPVTRLVNPCRQTSVLPMCMEASFYEDDITPFLSRSSAGLGPPPARSQPQLAESYVTPLIYARLANFD